MKKTAQLIGLDLETGGLNGYQILESGERVHGALYYPILEVGVMHCDHNLNQLGSFSVGIWNDSFLDRLHPWALKSHTESGLIDDLRNGSGLHDYVFSNNEDAADYIRQELAAMGVNAYQRKEKSGAIMFGNSIGFDMSFLDAQMPELAEFFSYRTIDVSSIELLKRTAWQSLNLPFVKKAYEHTALADINETRHELDEYTKHLKADQLREMESLN
ncbi:oligoribonuclease [Marinomonas sp. ef1]|uniref:oligoribonuclease n=1 Tax=Marinomonas sp. ef1 TaxID=2005043 RepID=UPI000C2867BC|nr:oligoribonuclease [Marinomonas sp. ef1]